MKFVKQMFVYGTLMSNERNHKLFKDSIIKIEEAKINAQLYHLCEHNCPTIKLGTGETIGELITYSDPDDSIENSIIALEQEFDGLYYEQIQTEIYTNKQILKNYVFVYQLANDNIKIEQIKGRWHSK